MECVLGFDIDDCLPIILTGGSWETHRAHLSIPWFFSQIKEMLRIDQLFVYFN